MLEIDKKVEKENKKDGSYYYKLFSDAFDFNKNRFDEITELVAYYELQQDNLTSLVTKPWVYQINTPFATDAVNLRVASLQANDYTGELEPLAPEDVEPVANINKVYKSFWKEMNMDNVINDSILISAVVGQAYSHVIFDDEKIYGGTGRKNVGKLKTYFLDSTSVQIDPKALSIKDADYIAVNQRITKNKAERDYPEFDFESLKQSSSPQDRGEIFVGNDYDTNQDSKTYNKITIYEKVDNRLEKTILIERQILVPTTVMPIREFPIAQLKWQKRLKSPYGTSLMSMLLPLQKVLNEIESANANANMQYSSPSYVLSEDAGIDPEELALNAGAPASVYVTASGYPIRDLIQPLIPDRGIDQGLVMTKQELERSIYKLAGVTEQFMGNMGTVGNTSGGADLAVQRAKTIEQRVLTNIEEYIEDLTRIIVEYIIQGFAGDTIYTKGEKKTNGSFDFNSYTIPEDADKLEYNFYIELNVKTQYSKEQQKQSVRELFEVERQYDTGEIKVLNILDILKTLNVPQTEELVQRYTDLMKVDVEQRAQMVTEIITTGQTFGVDANLVNAAIAEVIGNKQETPMIDQFMQIVQQMQQQQQQQIDTTAGAIVNNDISAEEEQMRLMAQNNQI